MLNPPAASQVYLACGYTDLRKSIDGLAAIVQEQFALNPFSTALFVFCNRKCDKIKILQWDHAGFWLYYRRLERGTFQWPSNGSAPLSLTQRNCACCLMAFHFRNGMLILSSRPKRRFNNRV